jgi:hypothetical protein
MSWGDPTDDTINTTREIVFRTALQAAADNQTSVNSTQTIHFSGAENQTMYITDNRFLTLGVAISLFGILAVAPTFKFWGWWEDGQDVSMSTLRVAKAFDAPLLSSADCNATTAQLLYQIRTKEERYGDLVWTSVIC